MKKICKNFAFSIIELVVVLAIITTLVAMIFPVLKNAREAGRKAVCVSNLKQIGVALSLYIDDYRHRLPKIGPLPGNDNITWHYLLNREYIDDEEVFYCPSYEGAKTGFTSPLTTVNIGYAVNLWVFGWDISTPPGIPDADMYIRYLPYDGVDNKTTKIFVLDSVASTYSHSVNKSVGSRHNDGVNVLFGDFHVEWHSKTSLEGKGDTWWEYE